MAPSGKAVLAELWRDIKRTAISSFFWLRKKGRHFLDAVVAVIRRWIERLNKGEHKYAEEHCNNKNYEYFFEFRHQEGKYVLNYKNISNAARGNKD
ncbi:hypothetical protein D6764_02920 [Candidatus Woesearchaeota archaeon]|nr:MAG: hypothetical protein D6764_02920 [Candidatus Woesearchaeota archaeon]